MSAPVIWPQDSGKPPAQQSLRGKTIVVGNGANAHVHPVFQPILRAIGPKVPYLGEDLVLEGEEPAQCEAYIAALKRHDWSWDYSDDSRSRDRGRESLRALKRMQPVVDPDGALWNAAAPAEFRLVLA